MSNKTYSLQHQSNTMEISVTAARRGQTSMFKDRIYASAAGKDECELLLDAIFNAFGETHDIKCTVKNEDNSVVVPKLDHKKETNEKGVLKCLLKNE